MKKKTESPATGTATALPKENGASNEKTRANGNGMATAKKVVEKPPVAEKVAVQEENSLREALKKELRTELEREANEERKNRRYTEVIERVSQIKAKSEQLATLEEYGRKLADMVVDGNTAKAVLYVKIGESHNFETAHPGFIASILDIARTQIKQKTEQVFGELKELS